MNSGRLPLFLGLRVLVAELLSFGFNKKGQNRNPDAKDNQKYRPGHKGPRSFIIEKAPVDVLSRLI